MKIIRRNTMSVTKNVGKRPANAVAERISVYEHDTIIFTGATGAKLVPVDLFTSPKKNSTILQSSHFPQGIGRALKLVGLKIEHNLRFEKSQDCQLFEAFSRFAFELDDVIYSPLHIGDFLSYNRAAYGGSEQSATVPMKSLQTALSKGGSYTKLARPIVVPETGTFVMRFIPGADLTTAPVTAENGAVKFGSGVVANDDPLCFFMKVTFVGELLREQARQLHTTVK